MKNKFGISDDVLEQIIQVFKKYESIKRVYLFGSRARGNYTNTSDIDLAIDCSQTIKLKLLRNLDELRCILKFDVIEINNIENKKLINNIKKDGILIYSKD